MGLWNVRGLKDSVVHSSCRWDPGVLHPGELQGQIWLRTRPLQGWLHFLLLRRCDAGRASQLLEQPCQELMNLKPKAQTMAAV